MKEYVCTIINGDNENTLEIICKALEEETAEKYAELIANQMFETNSIIIVHEI